jgi:hypothetical protein
VKFIFTDTGRDGLCCEHGSGSYKLYNGTSTSDKDLLFSAVIPEEHGVRSTTLRCTEKRKAPWVTEGWRFPVLQYNLISLTYTMKYEEHVEERGDQVDLVY